jgi:hypothetical protein
VFKFNSNHIFAGHIKQILNAFNLPSYRVYTAQHHKYFEENGVESPELTDGLYIKVDKILQYKNGKWSRDFDTFGYNRKITNITKNLPICNNIYDSDTHEYLGDFLRFQRDYLGVDLMPLYNCFSNRVCNNLNITITRPQYVNKVKTDDAGNIIYKVDADGQLTDIPELELTTEESKVKRAFYSKNTEYIIYMIPVKFFKEYTIALDCSEGVEICCGLYDKYLQELPDTLVLNDAQSKLPPVDMSQLISNKTYKKIPYLRFNNSMLWEGISNTLLDSIVDDCVATAVRAGTELSLEQKKAGYKKRLINNEANLKLFLKIPVKNQTSITILEGDYRDFNNYKYAPETKTKIYKVKEQLNINGVLTEVETDRIYTYKDWVKKQNHFITNYETELLEEDSTEPGATKIAYLPDVEDRPFRPISPLQLLMFNTKESYPFADRLMEYLSGNVITEWDEIADNIRRTQKVLSINNNATSIPGAWEGKMRNILYDYMMNGKPSGEQFPLDIAHDVLGYVDKDVEKFYTAWALEYCVDADGNRIRLTEMIDGKKVPIYGLVPKVLIEKETKAILDNRLFVLTTSDVGTIPLYKQRYVPIGSIGNIDIYDEEE